MWTAATESPPPTTDSAPGAPATALATASVPPANGADSNTPIGPFQKIVLARAIASAKPRAVSGPMSSAARSSGTIIAWTTRPDSALMPAAATTSRGSSTSTFDCLGLLEEGTGQRQLVLLDQRAPELAALGLEEGVGHRAADQHLVDATEQVVEHADLVRDLGAADDGHERPLDVAEQLAEELHLALHQEAHPLGGDELGDPGRRGVRAVRGAEGVVDVDVGVAGQRARERLVVGLLGRREAQVLQQRHRAGAQIVDHLAGAVAHRLVGQRDVGAEQLRQPRGDRLERVLLVGLALGAPEVRGEDDPRPLLDRQLDGRQALPDAGVVRHLPVGVSGTLKSTRMKRRRPAMSSSEIVLMPIWKALVFPAAGTLLGQKKARPVGAREECSEQVLEKLTTNSSRARSRSVVTRLMISLASATICFGS